MSNRSPLGDTQTGNVNGAALAAGNVLRIIDEMDHSCSIDMEILTDYQPHPNPPPKGGSFPFWGGIRGASNLKS